MPNWSLAVTVKLTALPATTVGGAPVTKNVVAAAALIVKALLPVMVAVALSEAVTVCVPDVTSLTPPEKTCTP